MFGNTNRSNGAGLAVRILCLIALAPFVITLVSAHPVPSRIEEIEGQLSSLTTPWDIYDSTVDLLPRNYNQAPPHAPPHHIDPAAARRAADAVKRVLAIVGFAAHQRQAAAGAHPHN